MRRIAFTTRTSHDENPTCARIGVRALQLRRRGIRVEVAATAQTLGTGLKDAANEVIDLVPLFETFDSMTTADA